MQPSELWALKLGINTRPVAMYPNSIGYVAVDVLDNLRESTRKLSGCKAKLDRQEKVMSLAPLLSLCVAV